MTPGIRVSLTTSGRSVTNHLCFSLLLCLSLQFNPNTPLKAMLLCWGPYGILAFYAAVENANLVSPKLRMVRMEKPNMHTKSSIISLYILKCSSHNQHTGQIINVKVPRHLTLAPPVVVSKKTLCTQRPFFFYIMLRVGS